MVSSLRIRKIFVEGVLKRFPKQMFSNGGFLIKILERFLERHFAVQSVMKTSLTKGFPSHFESCYLMVPKTQSIKGMNGLDLLNSAVN